MEWSALPTREGVPSLLFHIEILFSVVDEGDARPERAIRRKSPISEDADVSTDASEHSGHRPREEAVHNIQNAKHQV